MSYKFGFLLWLSVCVDASDGIVRNVSCFNNEFRANCSGEQVILILKAILGTQESCNQRPYPECSFPVLGEVHGRCSGKPNCGIDVDELSSKVKSGCSSKENLEIEYKCIEPYPKSSNCTVSIDSPNMMTIMESRLAKIPPCGTQENPLSIHTSPGKRIVFNPLFAAKDGDVGISGVVGGIHEENMNKIFDVFVGNKTKRNPIKINSSSIQIIINDTVSRWSLEIRTEGCAHVYTNHSITMRNFSQLKVSCKFSDDVWLLTCENDSWIGPDPVCLDGPSLTYLIKNNPGIVIAICFSLLVILTIGISCICLNRAGRNKKLKREHRQKDKKTEFVYKEGDRTTCSNMKLHTQDVVDYRFSTTTHQQLIPPPLVENISNEPPPLPQQPPPPLAAALRQQLWQQTNKHQVVAAQLHHPYAATLQYQAACRVEQLTQGFEGHGECNCHTMQHRHLHAHPFLYARLPPHDISFEQPGIHHEFHKESPYSHYNIGNPQHFNYPLHNIYYHNPYFSTTPGVIPYMGDDPMPIYNTLEVCPPDKIPGQEDSMAPPLSPTDPEAAVASE